MNHEARDNQAIKELDLDTLGNVAGGCGCNGGGIDWSPLIQTFLMQQITDGGSPLLGGTSKVAATNRTQPNQRAQLNAKSNGNTEMSGMTGIPGMAGLPGLPQ